MEKRVFLAIFLSFLVLVIYQAVFVPRPAPPGPGQASAPTAPAAVASQPAPGGTATQPATVPPAPDNAAAPLVADEQARDVEVDTDAIHAVFSTRGAVLKSWKLKRYFDREHKPLELVPNDVPDTYVRPFTLGTDEAATKGTLANALYRPSTPSLTLGSSPGTLTFEYRDASGLSAHKTFQFQPQGKPYLLTVDASIDVNGRSLPVTVAWGPALELGYNPDGSSESYPAAVVQLRNDKVERLSASKVQDQPTHEGVFRFAGVGTHYFLSVVLPGSQPVRMDYQPATLPIPGDPKGKTRTFVAYSAHVPGPTALTYFMGPKDLDVLRSVDPQMVRAIDFGMFAVFVVPLLQALKWINGYVGNFGWSIIVLTILINLAIFPLRHRSMVSMRKMQALQPEMKAIQERYAKYKMTDPERQKMNQEIMALYKQKGVNPASGCVPMLLTMPVLFAFYSLLSVAIELRGAPFLGWIHDLSLRDPYFITPVLMGATMVWQQRMMPSTADPVQQKMMMFMPVLFTTMFLWAPSGLVIYWLMSNIMAIGQQYLTNRIIGVPARVVRPAAARRV